MGMGRGGARRGGPPGGGVHVFFGPGMGFGFGPFGPAMGGGGRGGGGGPRKARKPKGAAGGPQGGHGLTGKTTRAEGSPAAQGCSHAPHRQLTMQPCTGPAAPARRSPSRSLRVCMRVYRVQVTTVG
jgi:hypothetical protein